MDGWGRAFLGVVVGVVVGFLLGGAGPRRESAALRKENETLGDELLSARKKGGRQMRFLPLPENDSTPRPKPTATAVAANGETPGAQPAPTEHFKLQIDEFRLAMDAQRIRIRQSRAVLEEKAKLDEADQKSLDAILAKMNEELAKHAQQLAEAAFWGSEQPPLDMLGMTHEVTGILFDAQKQYQDLLGPDYAQLDENTASVWNFVDLSYFQSQFEQAAADDPNP